MHITRDSTLREQGLVHVEIRGRLSFLHRAGTRRGTDPVGVDWDRERKKVLFLQTALQSGVAWKTVVHLTQPHFGATIRHPPVPIVSPTYVRPFVPPPFDIARQTPEMWGQSADED